MKIKKAPHVPMQWRSPAQVLACGFGSGLAPVAPGTFGTLAAVPIILIAQSWSWWIYLGVIVAMFVGGVFICDRAARAWGVQDHPAIVWDEIVGYMITMSVAPAGWLWMMVGFFLFRIFDIVKPWPIRAVDRGVHGGLGIMLDDVLAGVASGFVLYLAVRMLNG